MQTITPFRLKNQDSLKSVSWKIKILKCTLLITLKVCADPYLTTWACDWDELPKRGFPIIFHGVEGKDQQEEDSPRYLLFSI